MHPDNERKTLLIVDDVELFIQLQVSYLGNRRFIIHKARSGVEALKAVQELKPDLVLLDMFMPDMNGDRVCCKIKKNPETAHIPVIIVSSGGRELSQSATLTAGCDGLLFKPVRRDLLISLVEELLGINARKGTRAKVFLPGTLFSEERITSIIVHSLCTDGAFIETDEKLLPGNLIKLKFFLPDEKDHIEIPSAMVVWAGNHGEGGPRGVGARFMSIGKGPLEMIRSLVYRMPPEERSEDRDCPAAGF